MFSHNRRLQYIVQTSAPKPAFTLRLATPGRSRARCALATLMTGRVLHPNGGIIIGS